MLPTATTPSFVVRQYKPTTFADSKPRFYVTRRIKDGGRNVTQYLTASGRWTEMSAVLCYFGSESEAAQAAEKSNG